MSAVVLPEAGDSDELLALFRIRVAEDLRLLATLHDHEPDAESLQELRVLDFPLSLTLSAGTAAGEESMDLMRQALVELPEPADEALLDKLAADYASIYLSHNISASPEESVWLDEDGLKYQDSMFQVRGWYESYGLEIPDWRSRADDHLVYQLQFIATLFDLDDQSETLEKAATFMDEHLLRWLGNFAERVLGRCDSAYFGGLAGVTAAYCEALRDDLAEILEQPRPSEDVIELRMKPPPGQQVEVCFSPAMAPIDRF